MSLNGNSSSLALWSLLAALLSVLLWFSLEVKSISGLSLGKASSGPAWRTVLFETQFGRVWQVRLGLTAVDVCTRRRSW